MVSEGKSTMPPLFRTDSAVSIQNKIPPKGYLGKKKLKIHFLTSHFIHFLNSNRFSLSHAIKKTYFDIRMRKNSSFSLYGLPNFFTSMYCVNLTSLGTTSLRLMSCSSSFLSTPFRHMKNFSE